MHILKFAITITFAQPKNFVQFYNFTFSDTQKSVKGLSVKAGFDFDYCFWC